MKYYPPSEDCELCCSCWYARMRRDICGIYCTTGFVKDGRCDYFENYKQHKKVPRRSGNSDEAMGT